MTCFKERYAPLWLNDDDWMKTTRREVKTNLEGSQHHRGESSIRKRRLSFERLTSGSFNPTVSFTPSLTLPPHLPEAYPCNVASARHLASLPARITVSKQNSPVDPIVETSTTGRLEKALLSSYVSVPSSTHRSRRHGPNGDQSLCEAANRPAHFSLFLFSNSSHNRSVPLLERFSTTNSS